MAQIQELQDQLNRLRRQPSAADGNGSAAGRFASAGIMAFDLEALLASHDGIRPARSEPTKSAATKAAEELHARSKGYSTSVRAPQFGKCTAPKG